VIVAVCLLAGTARAQYPNPGPPTQPETPVPGTSADRPRFSVDGTVEPAGGTPVVRLDYRLARAELLFERRRGSYHAAYQLSAVFYRDKGDRQVTGDIFVRELDVKTYAETRPIGNDVIDHVELPVPPGKYDVEVVIRDLVAERASGTRIAIEVPQQAAGPVWFTDLFFGNVRGAASNAGGASTAAAGSDRAGLVPNPARRYSEDILSMAVYTEVVDSRPTAPSDSGYRVEYRVLNDLQERLFQRDTTIARSGGRTPFVLRPGVSSLGPGTYRFIVELKSPLPPVTGKRPAIRREKTFDVVQSAASIAADPKNTFEVLDYIITEKWERDEMKAADTEAKRKEFWERFWKRRDPTPDTPENEEMVEFYRRVQYANQHFGVGGPGWRSDMGRIYIQHGQPDEVVRSPFNFDRPPEEIWYYYRDRRTYYFVDHKGFGRYELDSSRSSR